MHHPPTGAPAPWSPEYTPHRRSVCQPLEETFALCGSNTVGITRNNSKHATQSCLMPCTIDWAPLMKSLVSFESSFPSRSKRISTGTVILFRRGTDLNGIVPALKVLQTLDFDTAPAMRSNPRPIRHIGNTVITGEVLCLSQLCIQYLK